MYAEAPFIKITFKFTTYETLTEDFIGSVKLLFSAINPISDEDVRLSKRLTLPRDRLRGFQRGLMGPKDGNDFIGGNYAAAMNLEARLPNFLPESSNTNVGLFMDFGNLWGVDYDSSISSSNKIRSSAGAIVNWLSPIGPMNFTFLQILQKKRLIKQTVQLFFRNNILIWPYLKINYCFICNMFSFTNLAADSAHFIDFSKVLNESTQGKSSKIPQKQICFWQ